MFWNKLRSNIPELLLFGLVIFLQFYRLDLGEIQSHDEARYILRADACLRFGAWLDQTQYSIGGLFSSSHPPLVVWMIAISRFLFGTGVFASRLVSPIAAVFALFFFYKFARLVFDRWTALFGLVSLGAAQNFLFYSHHGQFDIPMFAFVCATVYFATISYKENRNSETIIAGVFLGCVLMSKTFQGIYIVPFLFTLPYFYRSPQGYKKVLIITGLGILLALPWHLFMLSQHPEFISANTGLISSLKSNTYAQGATKTHWWYYLNVCVINFPLFLLGIFSAPSISKRITSRRNIKEKLLLITILWFAGELVVLSLFHTRMLHFSLFLLFPSALMICYFIEDLLSNSAKASKLVGVSVVLVCSIGWSGSELIRMIAKGRSIDFHLANPPMFIWISAITLILFGITYRSVGKSKLNMILLAVCFVLMAGSFYRWGSRSNATFTDGSETIGKILINTPGIHSMTSYHDGMPLQYMMPQFHYYSAGMFIGWKEGEIYESRTWWDLDSLIRIDAMPRTDAAVVYTAGDAFYQPKPGEEAVLNRINMALASQYSKSLHTKKYQLYWDLKKKL